MKTSVLHFSGGGGGGVSGFWGGGGGTSSLEVCTQCQTTVSVFVCCPALSGALVGRWGLHIPFSDSLSHVTKA